jgi:hypothetical protein
MNLCSPARPCQHGTLAATQAVVFNLRRTEMYKRIIPVLVAGLALWQWTAMRRQRQRAHQNKISRRKAPAVMEWEGEGGALRLTGSQVGPDPVPALTPPTPH